MMLSSSKKLFTSAALASVLSALMITPAGRAQSTLDKAIESSPTAKMADPRIVDVTTKMIAALQKIKNGECVFHRTEYKGKQLPENIAISKFNRRGDVFLRNTKGPNEGRDILYRPSKNNGKILVSNPVINLKLDPEGYLATRGTRFSIKTAGLIAAARRVIRTAKQIDALPPDAARHEWIGPRTILGQKTNCYRSIFAKDKYPALFAYKTEVCFSNTRGLPVDSTVWDKDKKSDKVVRQVGRYTYEKCRFNHLTAVDFDDDNPDYKF